MWTSWRPMAALLSLRPGPLPDRRRCFVCDACLSDCYDGLARGDAPQLANSECSANFSPTCTHFDHTDYRHKGSIDHAQAIRMARSTKSCVGTNGANQGGSKGYVRRSHTFDDVIFSSDPSDGLIQLFLRGRVAGDVYTETFHDVGRIRQRLIVPVVEDLLRQGATLVCDSRCDLITSPVHWRVSIGVMRIDPRIRAASTA